jgi:hypothetical protein
MVEFLPCNFITAAPKAVGFDESGRDFKLISDVNGVEKKIKIYEWLAPGKMKTVVQTQPLIPPWARSDFTAKQLNAQLEVML